MKSKHVTLSAIVLLTAASAFAAGPVPALTAAYGRANVTSLNGAWHYIVDPQRIGYLDYRHQEKGDGFFLDLPHDDKYALIEYDFDRSPTMEVPGAWNGQVRELFHYEGALWLRTKFDCAAAGTAGRRFVLQFGAVNYEARVYLNGRKLGAHVGGFTPFAFDVTDLLKPSGNSLVAVVDNARRVESVPTDSFDWWNWGGITRDVQLFEVPVTYISDVYLQSAKGDAGRLKGGIALNPAVPGEKVTLSVPELGLSAEATTGPDGKAVFDLAAEPVLWCPENPKLYRVVFAHGDERVQDEIGFRTVERVGREIRLNGKKVFLKGVCLHDEASGAKDRVRTRADSEALVARAKKLGCNFLRLAHYPHNEFTVRTAEKAGILVWSEIPTYWTIAWENPDTLENAKRQLAENIRRDRSRANVIIWSVANETPRSEARNRFLTELVKAVRAADGTRLVTLAMELSGHDDSSITMRDDLEPLVDVVSFNQYTGWYHPLKDTERIKWIIPYAKPVIVSEFGGGARYGLHGDENTRFSEEMQAAIYRENLKMLMKIDGISGLAPWILSDFRSPRRLQAGVQDGFNRKGLTDENGNEKMAFGVLKRFYEGL